MAQPTQDPSSCLDLHPLLLNHDSQAAASSVCLTPLPWLAHRNYLLLQARTSEVCLVQITNFLDLRQLLGPDHQVQALSISLHPGMVTRPDLRLVDTRRH